MTSLIARLVCAGALLAPAAFFNSAAAQSSDSLLSRLPREARDGIREARQWCKANGGGQDQNDFADAGLEQIDLNGDGARDIVVDWRNVACGAAGGGGCSNRGCDLDIFKQTGPGAWKRVFHEHVSGHFMSTSYQGRFRLLAVSLVGGNAQCKAKPTEPSSHEACDALVYWRGGQWAWQPIK